MNREKKVIQTLHKRITQIYLFLVRFYSKIPLRNALIIRITKIKSALCHRWIYHRGNGIKIKLKIAACHSLHISDHGNESFFLSDERRRWWRQVGIKSWKLGGRSRFLAPFLFIISFVAPFHLRPPRVTFGQLGKYCRELAPRNCEILLHPCPLPFPSVYIRDNKLARLGSALKPRFYLVMDRNEHLWMAREALGRRRLCELDLLSPKMRPFLFPSRSFIRIKFKKSTRENFYVNL